LSCGLGEETVYLALLGANVTAIDISLKMIEKAKKLAERYKVGNKITRLGAENTFQDWG